MDMQTAKIIEKKYYREGKSGYEIADELNYSPSSIYSVLRNTSNHEPRRTKNYQKVKELLDQGMSAKEIVEESSLCLNTVYEYIHMIYGRIYKK